jgi:hypothetical protein
MASLALMVAVIFLVVILSGPISLIAGYLGLGFLSQSMGVISIIAGTYWIIIAPFPVSALGLVGIMMGAKSFFREYGR